MGDCDRHNVGDRQPQRHLSRRVVAVARRGSDKKTASPHELNGIAQNQHIRHEFRSEQKQGAAHGVERQGTSLPRHGSIFATGKCCEG